MIRVSDKYYPAAQATQREWRGWVSFELFDVTAKSDAIPSAAHQPFSDVATTLDTLTDKVNYGTCEQDQFKVDGSMDLFPDSLFDKSKVQAGFIDLNTGAIGPSAIYPNSKYGDFIPITEGTIYYISGYNNDFRYRLYDADKNYDGNVAFTAPGPWTATEDGYMRPLFYLGISDSQLDKVRIDSISQFNFGWWSEEISGEDGTFENPPSITYTFSKHHSSIGLTLIFAEPVQDVALSAYDGDTLISTKDFTSLNSETVELYFPVENYTKLVIEVRKVLPYHYAKLLEVNFGIVITYDDDHQNLLNFDVLEEIDLMSRTVSSNTMSVSLNNMDQRFNMFNPQNEARFLQQRQKLTEGVDLLVDGNWEPVPLGQHYLNAWDSPTAYTTKFTANDILSLMTGTYYKSRLYDHERGETILTELFDAAGCYDELGNPLFYIHPNIRDIVLSGYIAPMPFRDALQRIAFALGAVVKIDRYGKILVYRATEETRYAVIIDKNTIYQSSLIGGTFSSGQGIILARNQIPVPNPAVIDTSMYQAPKTTVGKYYNQVNVSRLSWNLKDTADKLFEGEVSGDTVITFSSYPAAEVTISGTYVSAEIYACACVLHGAQGTITITGKVYQAATKTVTAKLPETAESTTPNALDIKDITLIGQDDTAEYIANWILEQLQNRITQSFKWWVIPAVEASDFVKVETSFGEMRESQVTKMHFVYDGALSGDSEVVG